LDELTVFVNQHGDLYDQGLAFGGVNGVAVKNISGEYNIVLLFLMKFIILCVAILTEYLYDFIRRVSLEFLQVMVTGINATWVDRGTSMQGHRER